MSNKQNNGDGRKAPPPHQKDQRKDPQEQVDICYNFVWGICQNGAMCKYRHELDIAVMRNMDIFCIAFQRHRICEQVNCVYIHSTKDQVHLFWLKGTIPSALAARHPVLEAPRGNSVQYGVQSTSQQQWPVGQLLEPPPPPPPPLQESATSHTHPNPRIYATENASNAVACLPSTSGSSQAQHLPTRIDTSRPPPNWPHNAARKRRFDAKSEDRPSKARKQEESGRDRTEINIETASTEQLREILSNLDETEEVFYAAARKRWAGREMTPEEEEEFEHKFLSRVLSWAINTAIKNGNTTNVKPAPSINTSLLQSILAPRRKQRPVKLSTLLEGLRKYVASQERSEPPVERAGPSAGLSAGPSAGTSGDYPRFVNEQETESVPPAAAQSYPPPHAQPAAAYPAYQPAVPPPTGHYYPHPHPHQHQHYHAAPAPTAAPAPAPVYGSRVAAPPPHAAPAPPAPAPHNYYYYQHVNAAPAPTAPAHHSSQYVYPQWYHPYAVMPPVPPGLPPPPPEDPSTEYPAETYGGPTTQNPHNGNPS